VTKRYLLAALVAPMGAVGVYGLLLGLRPVEHRAEAFGLLVGIAIVASAIELAVALPTLLAMRRNYPYTLPVSSIIGAALCSQVIGIPVVNFGDWGARHFLSAEVLSAIFVFTPVALVKCAVFGDSTVEGHWRPWKLDRSRTFGLFLVSLALWGIATVAVPALTVYWRAPPEVELFLRKQTPVGSTEAEVSQWLTARGSAATITRAVVPPNSDYPLSRTGGAAFIHATVAEYRLVLWAAVEAFYVFDGKGHLVDLRVRRTIDGP